ncbi:MAG: Cof-type HAD-IIB family hydrolase [Gudongella sp.]|nr:Cof-type HAD-IIB family hydrolase [Gudongella sp.]
MYRLIAIDLDGTLLNSSKKISDENREAVNRLIGLGYQVVIATGRRYYSAKMLVKELDSHLVIMANNGNIVRSSLDDVVLKSKFLDRESYLDILKEAKDHRLRGIVHVDRYLEGIDMVVEQDDLYKEHLRYLTEQDKRYLILPEKEIYKLDRVLAVVFPGDYEVVKTFSDTIGQKYPDRYSSHVLENIYIAEAMYEAMNPGGSKWKTLNEYAESIGIKREEIIAIGDDNNDVDMILNAGLGIAMRNGSNLAKSAADIVTERDNDHSGLAHVLEKVLKF